MNYTIELFFQVFSCANKLNLFVYKDWHRLSFKQFAALPDCSFMLLNREWVKSGNSISIKKD